MLYDREILFSFAVQGRMKDEAGYKIAQLKLNDIRVKGDFTYPSFFGFHGIHTCAELKNLYTDVLNSWLKGPKLCFYVYVVT